MLLAYCSGAVLALAVSAYAMLSGLDRGRAFYTTLVLVVASYYVLFAVVGGDVRALVEESAIAAIFLAVATMGFKRSSWVIAAALAAHGALDLIHGSVVSNDGVPKWWPAFCMTYDLTAAAFLAWTLYRAPSLAKPQWQAGL
jgi:hypothetical protein